MNFSIFEEFYPDNYTDIDITIPPTGSVANTVETVIVKYIYNLLYKPGNHYKFDLLVKDELGNVYNAKAEVKLELFINKIQKEPQSCYPPLSSP